MADLGIKPMLVEFTANWCPNCKFVEATVFTEDRMRSLKEQYGIEFVRVDEGYREYLRRLSSQELPAHPNKAEKAYYADEYQAKRDEKEFEKERQQLLKHQQ